MTHDYSLKQAENGVQWYVFDNGEICHVCYSYKKAKSRLDYLKSRGA